jgi:hypothetical protein
MLREQIERDVQDLLARRTWWTTASAPTHHWGASPTVTIRIFPARFSHE